MNNNTILLSFLVVVVAGLIFFFTNRDQTTAPVDNNETTQNDVSQAPVSDSNDEIIGMTTAEAEVFADSRGVLFRVVVADDEPQPTTRDYREGRINATTENDLVIDFYIEGRVQEDDSETDIYGEIIGLPEAAARAYAETKGIPFRIGTIDGQSFPVTMDFVPGRITAEIADGIVISHTVE